MNTEYFSVFIDDSMPYLLMLSNKNSAKHIFSYFTFILDQHVYCYTQNGFHDQSNKIKIIRQHMMWFTPIIEDTKEWS